MSGLQKCERPAGEGEPCVGGCEGKLSLVRRPSPFSLPLDLFGRAEGACAAPGEASKGAGGGFVVVVPAGVLELDDAVRRETESCRTPRLRRSKAGFLIEKQVNKGENGVVRACLPGFGASSGTKARGSASMISGQATGCPFSSVQEKG